MAIVLPISSWSNASFSSKNYGFRRVGRAGIDINLSEAGWFPCLLGKPQKKPLRKDNFFLSSKKKIPKKKCIGGKKILYFYLRGGAGGGLGISSRATNYHCQRGLNVTSIRSAHMLLDVIHSV